MKKRSVEAIVRALNDGAFGLAGYDSDGAGGFVAVRGAGGGSAPNQIEVVLNFFTEIRRLDPDPSPR